MESYKELQVWQRGITLAVKVYEASTSVRNPAISCFFWKINFRVNFKKISFGVFEKQGPMSPILPDSSVDDLRSLNDLDLFGLQFLIAALNFLRGNTKSQLDGSRIVRQSRSHKGTISLRQGEQHRTDAHFYPRLGFQMNRKSHDVMVEVLHDSQITTQQNHIIQIANRFQHLNLYS